MEGENRIPDDKIEAAKARLREVLTFEQIRKIPKNQNFTDAECLDFIGEVEKFAFLIVNSYIKRTND